MSQIEAIFGKYWMKGRLEFRSKGQGRVKGEAVGYYENGKINFIYPIVDGKIHGQGKCWHENGQMQCEESYKSGELHGFKRDWYPNGNIERESNYKNGAFDGVCKTWYKNGGLRSQSFFVNDRYEGIRREWYSGGELKLELEYREDMRNGISREWDTKGNLTEDNRYIRGVIVSRRLFDLLSSDKLTAQHILEIKNIEERRICLEEFGYGRFLSQVEHAVIDKDKEGELVRIDWHDEEESIFLVKVKCPSSGAFYTLRVPPTMKTAEQAVAWTFGLSSKRYCPELET